MIFGLIFERIFAFEGFENGRKRYFLMIFGGKMVRKRKKWTKNIVKMLGFGIDNISSVKGFAYAHPFPSESCRTARK
jgi:hypothetical protein